MIVTNKH